MKYYVDCEFDGHNGPLLSIALIREDGVSLYIVADSKMVQAQDPWVIENVVPHLHEQNASTFYNCAHPDRIGSLIRDWLGFPYEVTFIADSPVDIGRLCELLMSHDGEYNPNWAAVMKFEAYDINCYPTLLAGATQHNAYWDAMALRAKFRTC